MVKKNLYMLGTQIRKAHMRLTIWFPILKIAQAAFIRDCLTCQVLLLMLAFVYVGWQSADAADVKQVSLWDGETSATPDGLLINRYGGPVVHLGGTKITVSHVTDFVHSGHGAYRAAIAGPVSDFAFFQLALSGFGPTKAYVMSRDILRFDSLCFWLKNDTGVPFTLKLEIKDYRDSSDYLQFRRYDIPASSTWTPFCAPLMVTTGWTVVGNPDLQQARFIGFVFEAKPGLPLNGSVYFDDVVLVEPGNPMDSETAPLPDLVLQITRRQFDGLWGSRSRTHGMVPLNSVYADVGALNSTSALVKLLPVAIKKRWVTQVDADAYITTIISTLNRLMDHATYLPPRYVDWVTLTPNFVQEESPVDAAFLALALYQYRSLPCTPLGLRDQIDALLSRFNFAAFGSPQGWKLAYSYGPPPGFTPGSYDGYSGEIWTISLAAHVMPTNRVDITQYYHTGINRVRAFCAEPSLAHVVHSDARFRAPFLQWLFPLFVKLYMLPDVFPVDNYPVSALATNPFQNAVRYQLDVHRWLDRKGRKLFLQPDAGDDGSGMHYEQYSCYNDFGEPFLFMPWSAAFSLLAELTYAEPALRNHLAHGLHGPLGLSDSVQWITGAQDPAQITARHDFWNVSLSTMAMSSFLFQDNEFLTSLPEIHAALEKVFPHFPPRMDTKIGIFRNGTWALDMNGNGAWDPGIDIVYSFGLAGDIPITGDWNGDGFTKIGVFRSGSWYLDYSGNGEWDGCSVDKCYYNSFGLATDIPAIGDWSRSGTDKIGVFRSGKWYLDYDGSGTWNPGDKTYTFGLATDTPVVGDWSGDGVSKIGVKRGANWHLDYDGSGTWNPGDKTYTFGLATDIPVTGDWNGNGFTKIGVFRSGNWYLDYDGCGTWNAGDKTYSFGLATDKPVTGKWRTPPPAEIILLEGEGGTGLGQIMTRSAASGKETVWLHTGESRMISFQIPSHAHYSVNIRYSNDNFGPLETVQVEIDGSFVGQFIAQDTGDYGLGWNNFLWSDSIAVVDLSTGSHQMTITATGGDGYGVEIDVARLDVR